MVIVMDEKKDTNEMHFVISSKIRDIAKGFSVSKGFEEALNAEVKKIILKACSRAHDNKRNTLMARDV